jgi:hypothetical protein
VNSQESGAGDGGIENLEGSKTPLFKNSIVSTEIDFIQATDPDTFLNLGYIRQEAKEMPGNGSDDLIDQNTYVFRASFKDDTSMEIWAHSSFGSRSAAEEYADKLTPRLGKLPALMRKKINHVIINKGDSTAFAEDAGGFFVLYSDNMDTRISNNDLEETVFHESVHVAFDLTYANSEAWKQAQDKDGVFITEYAESRPNKEDLAETAIFAYTMRTHPGRLDQDIEAWVRTNIPNRLDFLEIVFE